MNNALQAPLYQVRSHKNSGRYPSLSTPRGKNILAQSAQYFARATAPERSFPPQNPTNHFQCAINSPTERNTVPGILFIIPIACGKRVKLPGFRLT